MGKDGHMRVLDSHLHLWDPALLKYSWLEGPLQSVFSVAEAHAASHGLEAEYVFVQAECAVEQYVDEVSWVSSLAAELGVRGIVAGARLDRGDATVAHLDALGAHPLVVGVRHLLQGEPDGFAGTSAFRDGIAAIADRGRTFDACVRAEQIADVTALAAFRPDLRIVLDHLGKPAVGTAECPLAPSAQWLRDISELAAQPQVHMKLSGLPAEAGGSWSAEQVHPFLDAAVDAFGPERLMVGSDWPVSAQRGIAIEDAAITTWVTVVASWAEDRGHDVDAILYRNAENFYGLV